MKLLAGKFKDHLLWKTCFVPCLSRRVTWEPSLSLMFGLYGTPIWMRASMSAFLTCRLWVQCIETNDTHSIEDCAFFFKLTFATDVYFFFSKWSIRIRDSKFGLALVIESSRQVISFPLHPIQVTWRWTINMTILLLSFFQPLRQKHMPSLCL